MAQMCHAQNSQIKPQRLGMALSISAATLLVLFVPLLILGLSPSASAGPPQGPVLPGALTANAQLLTTGTYTVFLPLAFENYRTPISCTPQVWYTFSSFGSTPMGMAYDVTRTRLFVANHDSNSLAVINAATGQNIRLVTNLPEASGVAFDAARNLIYVVGQNWLNVVDGATYAVTKTIFLGISPDHNMEAHAAAYNQAKDKLYVTGFNEDHSLIVIVNVADWSVKPLMGTGVFPISSPAYVTVNSFNDKVYVANHQGGPTGWVTIIDGTTDEIIKNLNPAPDTDHGGDLYGIAADGVHNRVYVTSISAAYVYVIDGATDTTLGAIKIVRAQDQRPVPMRMIAVNPNAGGETHLWLTSYDVDKWGEDRLILLPFPNIWPTTGLTLTGSAVAVAPSPERGLLFDPTSGYVFASSTTSNLVTVSQDGVPLCAPSLNLSANDADPEQLRMIVNDYRHPQTDH